ncbi:conserved hypothetical protein [Hyphomicrobiales bacterium]|nr:conserved hypothetical protein [Hyphomicrobiales bacterium]CAH1663857.1 conserved hypothetical protein [Hyphomicrobiales bacterium]
MQGIAYYVVMPIVVTFKGMRVVPGEAYEVADERSARRAVAQLGGRVIGAIAFTRVADGFGGYTDAAIIAQNGFIPDNLEEVLQAA